MSPVFNQFFNDFLILNQNTTLPSFDSFHSLNLNNNFILSLWPDYVPNTATSSNSQIIIDYINQTEDLNLFNNFENLTTIYNYSIPNTKLAYPEPFIASPSFMHSDLWFIHILIYQYWLWFVFIFIIIFFFITFLCTVRWCNMRVRPRRETRGVSRSKCGDLITACVPVSWATSIIVNESTDAIDYYDGFGTTELVVGIRAYQWGWEYYYPKDIDLNYNIKPNYSTFVGNSLKYTKTSEMTTRSNNLWKFYQNKNNDQVVTPAHFLVIPFDNYKLFNFLNFNDIGSNTLSESNSFKKIRSFSKTFTSNLVNNEYSFNYKYKHFSNLYFNPNNYSDSFLFGTKRQHNYLTSHSILNNQISYINYNSFLKILNYNYSLTLNDLNKLNHQFNFKKTSSQFINFNYFNKNFNESTNFFNFILFNNIYDFVNNDSDKKTTPNIQFKMFNLKFIKNLNKNFVSLNNVNNVNDLNYVIADNEFLTNKSNINKNVALFSPNQSVSLSNKFLRNFITTTPNNFQFNHSQSLNFFKENFYKTNKSVYSINNDNLNLSKLNWLNTSLTKKISLTKFNIEHPYSPINSTHPLSNSFDYDTLNNTNIDNLPLIFQGKEENMPNFLTSIYWNFFWNNTSIDWKLQNSAQYHIFHKLNYLPLFNFYYDYDFRNWQAIQLLEDSIWDSVISLYTNDEYENIVIDFYDNELQNKFEKYYNNQNKNVFYKDKIINKSFFKNTNVLGEYYNSPILFEENFNHLELLNTKNFFIYPNYFSLNYMEDSFDSLKNLNHFFNFNFKNFLLTNSNNMSLQNFYSTADTFQSSVEDFFWFFDENNFNNFKEFFFNDNYFLTNSKNLDLLSFNSIFQEKNVLNDKLNRFSNNLNVRGPVKNANVTYNALQKVFRTRYDENRSHARWSDLSLSYNSQPFLTSKKISYENLLGKNKENFLQTNNFKPLSLKNINYFYENNNSINHYMFDFPFLLALKSDASRYLWFDWFSKWGFYEVQPSSSSRYAIYGMPYLSKNFEFSTQSSETLTESETYLLRLERARKNYITNWTYTPYFFAKSSSWFKNNDIFENSIKFKNPLNVCTNTLSKSNWFWKELNIKNYSTLQFHPSNSGINSYAKLGWQPQNSIQSYYYNTSNLIDILTKREFLYREYYFSHNKKINLPNILTASSNNPLLNEIKATFLFIDPLLLNNEYSRDLYFSSLNFFYFMVLKSFLSKMGDSLNINLYINNTLNYFFSLKNSGYFQYNNELFKSQYRPMRKGISNMIRLHATGAVALPSEIRLQILASSKDVIHSWAVPSAGIKIDCVPGYSSHKVMIFLVSGIFWGQCMEICGRYHHWMPIVVYFMKRDLFFLWCTHFVFLNTSNNMWNINDREFTDYVRLASFDKYSWINELKN